MEKAPNTATPRTKQRIVRPNKIVRARRPVSAAPPQHILTNAEAVAALHNDPANPIKTNAEIAAIWEGYTPDDIDMRVHLNIQIARLKDRLKALDEGFLPE